MKHKVWKIILYDLGYYQFKVPTVHHTGWARDDWIQWIDGCNGWLPNQGKKPYFMPEWLRKLGVTLNDDQFYDAGTMLEVRNAN